MHHRLGLLDAGQVACGRRGLAGWETAGTLRWRERNNIVSWSARGKKSKRRERRARPATKEARQAHRCLCLTQESSEHPPSLCFYSEGVWFWFNGRHFLCRSCWKCHPFHPDSNHLPSCCVFLPSVSCIHRVSDSQPGPLPAHCWFNLLWWEQPARKKTWGLPDSSQTHPPPG